MSERVTIPKNNNDPFGLEFEIALMKARYVYPAPDNTNIHSDDILGHAKQIYESEMLERSLCAFYKDIVPVTYRTTSEHLSDKILHKQSSYKIVKYKSKTNTHIRNIYEMPYEFLDVLHVPSRKVIECKVHKSDAGLERHRRRILERRNVRRGDDLSDYYLICLDKDHEFEVTEFLSFGATGRFVRENFEEFMNA